MSDPVETCAVRFCKEPPSIRDLCKKHFKVKKFRERSEQKLLNKPAKPKPVVKIVERDPVPTSTRKLITLDYRPRKQFLDFHNRTQRFALLVTHRRAGKSVACINDLIRRASQTPNGRYGYIAPFYAQAKMVAFDYLCHYASPLLAATPNVSELRVDLVNGSRIQLFGADNADRLRGLGWNGVVLDEFGDFRPGVWSEIIRPALADRQGWAVFVGTPRGKNEFWELYEIAKQSAAWYTLELKASQTGILPQEELDAAKDAMSKEQYEQEFETSFESALIGAFYAEELSRMRKDGRIGKVPIERAIPVSTSWDLGISDSSAIWFAQFIGREIRLIDYYEADGQGLDHYAEVLNKKGYVYDKHFLPHDVQVRELGTGMSRVDTLYGLGIDAEVVPVHNILDGINATRRFLDRCWIDETRCERGIEALKQFRREFDDRLKVFKQKPRHGWESHGADALRYMATGHEDKTKPKKTKRPRWMPRMGGGWMGA